MDDLDIYEAPLKKARGRAKKGGSGGGSINLGNLDSGPSPISSGGGGGPPSRGGPPSGGGGPVFKAFFDLLLYTRPGFQDITFRNFHPIFLVDYIPNEKVKFSFEVRTNPRFYELDYSISKSFTLRLGRIWIPFDDMDPHNNFGGVMNTSEFRSPGGAAFLPDIWADFGVGARTSLIDTARLGVFADLYVVIGFGQNGGIDPLGSGSPYPFFSQPTAITAADNNTDKSIGGRIQLKLGGMLSIGGSIYRGRYTNETEEPADVMMSGIDTQLRLFTGTTIRIGFVYMKVDLLADGENAFMERGGLYAEFMQRLRRKIKIYGMAGVLQGDHRSEDANDRTLLGVKIAYEINDYMQLSLLHFKDVQEIPGKTGTEFTGLRYTIRM